MSEIHHNPSIQAALKVVTEHAAKTDTAITLNALERHDPLHQAIVDGFAALDLARQTKDSSVSAKGLGMGNPLINPEDIHS